AWRALREAARPALSSGGRGLVHHGHNFRNRTVDIVASVAKQAGFFRVRLVGEDIATAGNDESIRQDRMLLVALLQLAVAAGGIEDLLEEVAESEVFVTDQVGLARFGVLERAPDGLAERADRHVVGATRRRVIRDLGSLTPAPGNQRRIPLGGDARKRAND